LWQTVFVDVDLSTARGLESTNHLGPSYIGVDTIYLSEGDIPRIFLQGCGVPENFIAFIQLSGARQKNSSFCALSYSIKDQAFAKKLHDSLENNGVRCWLAPDDLKTGDRFHIRIDEAIKVYNKLFLILSENSIESSWIEGEIETALERERKQKAAVLFPIRLDDSVMTTSQTWAVDMRQTRQIEDMSGWEDERRFKEAVAELLHNFNAEEAITTQQS
jgi:hypothetical protein